MVQFLMYMYLQFAGQMQECCKEQNSNKKEENLKNHKYLYYIN